MDTFRKVIKITKGEAAVDGAGQWMTAGSGIIHQEMPKATYLDVELSRNKEWHFINDADKEPIAWGGPIVMNTNEELQAAFEELDNDTFIKNS